MLRTLSSTHFPFYILCPFQHFVLVYLWLEKWKVETVTSFPGPYVLRSIDLTGWKTDTGACMCDCFLIG